jgi:hypothetical protein
MTISLKDNSLSSAVNRLRLDESGQRADPPSPEGDPPAARG